MFGTGSSVWVGKICEGILVSVAGEENQESWLCVARAILLLRMSAYYGREPEKFSFVHFMECACQMDNVDALLG